MTYQRVLPRDLFNESKLLKCLGRVALLVQDGKCPLDIHHNDDLDPGFLIDQNPDDGSFYCVNLSFRTKSEDWVDLCSGLNSRRPYPLWYSLENGECGDVFDDTGNLTSEFLESLKRAG